MARQPLTFSGVTHPPRKQGRFVDLAAVVASLAIVVIALLCHVFEKWRWLKVPPLLPKFSDLAVVTYTSECARLTQSWTMDSPTCHPAGLPYNYPSLWVRLFKVPGVTGSHTEAIGIALFAVVAACCYIIVKTIARNAPKSSLVLLVFILLSPPTWLILERGNIDAIIFALLVVTVIVGKRTDGWRHVAVGLIAIATNLKVFPAASSLLAAGERVRVKFAMVGLFVLFGGWRLISELRILQLRTPQSREKSFGLNVLPQHLANLVGESLQSRYARASGLAILALAALVAVLVSRTMHAKQFRLDVLGIAAAIHSNRTHRSTWLVFGTTFIFVYMIGSNWDYRLVFIYPLAAVLADVTESISRVRFLLLLIVGVVYMSYPAWYLQPVGDIVVLALLMVVSVITFLVVLEELPPTLAQPIRRLARAAVR